MRYWLKNFFVILAMTALLKGRVYAVGSEQRGLSLEECIHIAIENATTVLKAENAVKVSGAQVMQSYAQFLPNLQGLANFDYSRGRTYLTIPTPTNVSSRNYGPSYQLSSSINIFNGYSDYATMKAATDKKNSNELSLYRAKEQIAIDVTQAFLQVVLDQELVTISKENVRVSQERQTLLKEQTRLGVRNLADLYRQEAQTSTDEAALISTENKLLDDEILLIKRLRLDATKNYTFINKSTYDQATPLEQLSEAVLIDQALKQRTDYQASQKNVSSADWSIRSAESTYYPKLDFNTSLSSSGRIVTKQFYNGTDVTPHHQTNEWAQLGDHLLWDVGVSLTWTIFDRELTRYAVAQAAVAKANAEIDREDEKLQVISDVRQAKGDLSAAKRRLEATDKGIRAAEKAFETVQGRYQVGASSFLDLITAQSVLVDSKSAKAEAQMDTLLQESVLATSVGSGLLLK